MTTSPGWGILFVFMSLKMKSAEIFPHIQDPEKIVEEDFSHKSLVREVIVRRGGVFLFVFKMGQIKEDAMKGQFYHKLRDHLNQYSVGFPVSESGVEIEILKKLFAPEEAELLTSLGLKPETVETITARIGRDTAEIMGLLDRMLEKGLIFCRLKEGVAKYAALPFAPGIFEQQINTMDPAFAELFEKYFQEVFHESFTETKPVLIHRPIPINRTVDVTYPMATYDHSREIVRNQDLIAVTNCVCRVQKGAINNSCYKPVETCLMFGSQAQYYMDRGTGRKISADEAIAVLDRCEDSGLVTMPFNSQSPANICNCCSDCCVVLAALKKHPRPAEMIRPAYSAFVDPERCEACETCLGTCPMDAIAMGVRNVMEVDLYRCIGCGLCVKGCPVEAIHLKPKPEHEQLKPPQNTMQTFMKIAQIRQQRTNDSV